MLDIIFALGWVGENIRTFGGDPDNVTIFGESGGAAKVSVLMAMPAAAGLFHKAIVQSSPWNRVETESEAISTTQAVACAMGSPHDLIGELIRADVKTLLDVELKSKGAYFSQRLDASVPRHPFVPDAPAVTRNVPMLIGTNAQDGAYLFFGKPDAKIGSDDDVVAQLLNPSLGVDAQMARELLSSYRESFQNVDPRQALVELVTAIWDDEADMQAGEKSIQPSGAKTYRYCFDWQGGGLAKGLGSAHTFEIPFVFGTLDAAPQLFDAGVSAGDLKLSAIMSSIWTNFAWKGVPSGPGVPQWPAFDEIERSTMYLGYSVRAVKDPRSTLSRLFSSRRATRYARISRFASGAGCER